jgi:parallel beta-helix repeat protein
VGFLDPPPLNSAGAVLAQVTAAGIYATHVNALGPDSSVIGDGVADDRAALIARAATAATFGAALLLPAKVYHVGAQWNLAPNIRLLAEPGAKLKGSLDGAALMTVGAGAQVSGLVFDNQGAGICLSVRTSATNVDIDSCEFIAGSQGVSLASSGIANVHINRCQFTSGLGYGILSNAGANDLRNLKVTACDFLDCQLDPIEFNHPSVGPGTARDYLVQGCYFSQSPLTGNSTASGFGIGAAGVTGLRIEGNTFNEARLQAIHIEDDCTGVVVAGNAIRNCGDPDQVASSKSIWLTASSGVVVTDNNISGTNVGAGIYVVYDGGSGVSELLIANNRVTGCADDAIEVAGDGTGVISVTGNVVAGNGGDGIYLRANTPNILVTGNTVVGNAGWGIRHGRPGTAQARILACNLVSGNALGDYDGAYSTPGEQMRLCERQSWTTSTAWAATSATAFPLFRAGGYAAGTVWIACRAIDGSMITSQLWRVTWDGAALTADALKVSTTGPVTSSALSVVDGFLTLNLANPGAAKTVTVWADFRGDILEDGLTRIGTVAGTAT